MAQLMPLPLAVSCFSKIQIGFTILIPAHPGSPGRRAVKRVLLLLLLLLLSCLDIGKPPTEYHANGIGLFHCYEQVTP